MEHIILNMVLCNPGIFLRELKDELSRVYDVEVQECTICIFLKRSGFTRQKMRMVAARQDQLLREMFALDVCLYDPSMLVFVDETGADRRDCLRKHGYSVRGKPIISQKLTFRGERVSAIVGMTSTEILDYRLTQDSVDAEEFERFVEDLLPQLMPFNGTNPNSIVILDNCAIHHVDRIVELFQQCGVMVHFLPPYSPDYNPIEEAFSKIKSALKSMEDALHSGLDLHTCMAAAFADITGEDCQSWLSHCGIYNH